MTTEELKISTFDRIYKLMNLSEERFETLRENPEFDYNNITEYVYDEIFGVISSFNIKSELSKTPQPKYVGYLNKVFGYNGFKPVEIGTDVFEEDDRFYFFITNENNGQKTKVKFYKNDLKNCINYE